jgi:hypothetical protein
MIDVDNTQPTDFHQDQEPDQASYTDKEYSSRVMASDEFKRDYDEFLESVRGES